jgi:hypothetical protein
LIVLLELKYPSHADVLQRGRQYTDALLEALSGTKFAAHLIWPERESVYLVLEGDGDANGPADAIEHATRPDAWRVVRTLDTPGEVEGLGSEERSHEIASMAVAPDPKRCDYCGSSPLPPHLRRCEFRVDGGQQGASSAGGGDEGGSDPPLIIIDEPQPVYIESPVAYS